MKYIEYINELIRKEVRQHDHLAVFGQNVSAGSCIGGFTKGLEVRPTGRIINTPNTENALCGLGFGAMIRGANAIFFMKQLDFLLLGIDQLVNTYNIIRNQSAKPTGSFTIMPIIMDNGYQGPQSSFNGFSDFCSIARIPGYTVTNKYDADAILSSYLVAPGFRIICISQRLFKEELLTPESLIYRSEDATLFQYSDGTDVTIVSFNLTFPQALQLDGVMKGSGIEASLFNVNSPTPTNWKKIVENAAISRRLVVLDDSKSEILSCYAMLNEIQDSVQLKTKQLITKKCDQDWLTPNSDQLEIRCDEIIAKLGLPVQVECVQ